MNNRENSEISRKNLQLKSKAGYVFEPDDYLWKLDKNNSIYVGAVCKLLEMTLADEYIKVLTYYAINYTASYVRNINDRFSHFLQETDSNHISVFSLINYRSKLNNETEWYLGVIRVLIRKWHNLGYPGVSNEVMQLLDGWVIKGNIKGDVIKRLDPQKGPLSDLELQGFNDGLVQAYEKDLISLTDMAMGLLMSNTGRRPIQISHLRLRDVLNGKNKGDGEIYLINVPRAKQRDAKFRDQFKQFAITKELWCILSAQANHVIRIVETKLGFELQEHDRFELPLFPDMPAFSIISTPVDLRKALENDQLHIKSSTVTEVCKNISEEANVKSERTGKILSPNSYRFRYTTGTRAAREGFGVMVIAELLDHADTQNAGVYIENIPEHVENLDKAVGHQLARYAQAFAGVIVDNEAYAKRGNDLSSRIKTNGEGIGTCGSYSFCGANVPVPCYTCMHFQPWLDGPHEIVYEELLADRERLIGLTGDLEIAAINDRTIIAVAEVIDRCAARKKELANG
jgi:integrase